jgi:hypothetical protein
VTVRKAKGALYFSHVIRRRHSTDVNIFLQNRPPRQLINRTLFSEDQYDDSEHSRSKLGVFHMKACSFHHISLSNPAAM